MVVCGIAAQPIAPMRRAHRLRLSIPAPGWIWAFTLRFPVQLITLYPKKRVISSVMSISKKIEPQRHKEHRENVGKGYAFPQLQLMMIKSLLKCSIITVVLISLFSEISAQD